MKYMVVHKQNDLIKFKNYFIFYKEHDRLNVGKHLIKWHSLYDKSYYDRFLLNEFILDEMEANEVFDYQEEYVSYTEDDIFKISINDNYESLTDEEFFNYIHKEIDNYLTLKEII